jgi:Uncharacterized protein conserved in bacteria (DUF2130)
VVLRQSLIELSNSRFVQQGQETKMGQVYKYLTGMKFRQRVEAVIEKFEDMRNDLDRERKFMGKQWSKCEAQILAVVDSTVGMVGDLQGIAGKAMPEIPSLDMPLLASTDREANVSRLANVATESTPSGISQYRRAISVAAQRASTMHNATHASGLRVIARKSGALAWFLRSWKKPRKLTMDVHG